MFYFTSLKLIEAFVARVFFVLFSLIEVFMWGTFIPVGHLTSCNQNTVLNVKALSCRSDKFLVEFFFCGNHNLSNVRYKTVFVI